MIFVDTGAWYALATASDPDHEAAKAFVASNSETFVTTDYVVDELLTLFDFLAWPRQLGISAPLVSAVGEAVPEPGGLTLIAVSAAMACASGEWLAVKRRSQAAGQATKDTARCRR